MTPRRFRYLYVCNAFEDGVRAEREIDSDSPAASRKVMRLCGAIRKIGGDVCVLSLGRGRQKGTWRWFGATTRLTEQAPIAYASYWDAPLLTHIATAVSLAAVFLRIASARSVLVFYNPQPHYLLVLLLGRLMGARCLLDLEDGVIRGDKGLRALLQKSALRVYDRLCNGGAMLASRLLRGQTRLRPQYVCYGVAPMMSDERDWSHFPIHVLFGGSLYRETGVGLFLAAVRRLWDVFPETAERLRFVVTGFGALADTVRSESRNLPPEALVFLGRINDADYEDVVRRCHVGLCLKLPDTGMGDTTFPSKVVELASSGLLIVSTKVSDVPEVLPDGASVLLREATPEALSSAFVAIVNAPEQARTIAREGQRRIHDLLSEERIGADLLAFWAHGSMEHD